MHYRTKNIRHEGVYSCGTGSERKCFSMGCIGEHKGQVNGARGILKEDHDWH